MIQLPFLECFLHVRHQATKYNLDLLADFMHSVPNLPFTSV